MLVLGRYEGQVVIIGKHYVRYVRREKDVAVVEVNRQQQRLRLGEWVQLQDNAKFKAYEWSVQRSGRESLKIAIDAPYEVKVLRAETAGFAKR